MTYLQRFHGVFTAYAVQGTPHCGVMHGRIECPVEIQVRYRAGAEVLDQDGFLLDNTWFRQYLADFYHVQLTISCERVAALMAEQIMEAAGGRAEWASVDMEPVHGVHVVCEHELAVAV